jgi:putative membrane protein
MILPPWHPHPEVWALIITMEGAYLWALRRLAPEGGPLAEEPVRRTQVVAFTLGVAALWVAADWPLHDLSEGYLFSVHMVSHMLISLVAPPLLLFGTPSWLLRRILSPRPLNWAIRTLARPFMALVIFNGWIVLSHWPAVMEFSLYHHWFHFFAHVILLLTAVLMWWTVISPLPEMPTLSYPGRMMYLFLQSIVPTVPASFLTFGNTPLYHFYTTVPRIWHISVMTDQLVSGLVMKLGGGAILWTFLGLIFFKWYAMEQGSEGWDALQWHDVETEIQRELARPATEASEE